MSRDLEAQGVVLVVEAGAGMAEVKAPAKLFVHWPDGLRRDDGTRDVLLAAAKRQVPSVVDILLLANGESETGQYVYLKFADKILRYTLEWV